MKFDLDNFWSFISCEIRFPEPLQRYKFGVACLTSQGPSSDVPWQYSEIL